MPSTCVGSRSKWSRSIRSRSGLLTSGCPMPRSRGGALEQTEDVRPDPAPRTPAPASARRPGRFTISRPSIEIRPLGYGDLPEVIAIERRSFPAPWSLAMFVLELSKPSGICLAAVRDEHIVGYLVCSRYDTV